MQAPQLRSLARGRGAEDGSACGVGVGGDRAASVTARRTRLYGPLQAGPDWPGRPPSCTPTVPPS